MGLGTSRVSPTMESRRVQLGEEAHHPYECFVCGYASGHHCQVLLSPSFSWVGANSCPLKVHDGVFRGGLVRLTSARQMPRISPESTHSGDTMGRALCYDHPQGRSQGRRAPPDQDSYPTPCRSSSSPTLSWSGGRYLCSWVRKRTPIQRVP